MRAFDLFEISAFGLVLVLPLLVASVLAIVGVRPTYKARTQLENFAVYILFAGVTGWCFFYALEISTASLELKIVYANIQFVCAGLSASGWLCNSLLLTQGRPPYLRSLLIFACAPAIVFAALTLTNDHHQLVWHTAYLSVESGRSWLAFDRKPVFIVFVFVMYVQILLGSAIMGYTFFRREELSKAGIGCLLLAIILPLFLNAAFLLDHVGPFDPTPFSLLLVGYVFSIVRSKQGLVSDSQLTEIDLVQTATVGLVAVNSAGVIKEMNPQAITFFKNSNALNGMHIRALFPDFDVSKIGHECRQTIALGGDSYQITVVNFPLPTVDFESFLIIEKVALEKDLSTNLNQSISELSDLPRGLALGICDVDLEDCISQANDPLLAMSGFSRDELFGRNLRELLWRNEIEENVQGSDPFDEADMGAETYTLVSEANRRVPVLVQSLPRLEDGVLKGHRKYILNISGRYEANTKLVKMSVLYDHLVDLAPFGVCFVKNNRILLANSQAGQIVGISENDSLINRIASEVLPGDIIDVIEGLKDVYSGETVVRNERGRQLTLQFHASPLPGDNQQVAIVFEDVTLEHRQTQELIDIRHRYQSLVNSSRDMLFLTDVDGNILDANPHVVKNVGYAREEFLHLQLSDLIVSEDFSAFQSSLRLIEAGESKSASSVVRLIDRKGNLLVLDVESMAFQSDEQIVLYQHLARDITEEKQLQERLTNALVDAESASASKSDFLASMSHEIRTPMNGVLGVAQLMKKGVLPSDQEKQIDSIIRSSEVLLGVLSDILDLSSMEKASLELNKSTFSPEDLVGDMHALFDYVAVEKGLEFKISTEGMLPEKVYGDKDRISQILYNLMSNAIKFTKDGVIEIIFSESERAHGKTTLKLSVSDTGIGMTREQIDSVFSMFSKADLSLTRATSGSGLGLAVTSHLVDLMGGRLVVNSTLGEGSVFDVMLTLPIANEDSIEAEVVSHYEGRRILIAEDNPVNVEVICGFLAHLGCHTTTAVNGQEALDAIREDKFDLILMDVQMPIMDGLTATKEIRKLEVNNAGSIPIIATTAGVMGDEIDKCFAAGMNDYISKPIYLERLAQVLDEYLSS